MIRLCHPVRSLNNDESLRGSGEQTHAHVRESHLTCQRSSHEEECSMLRALQELEKESWHAWESLLHAEH